jgi:lipid-A-disaccharide synthase-like uncharacterized protein
MQWIGYVGLAAFGLAWIPQSLETVKAGRCGANLSFLLLGALGSISMMSYAIFRGEQVFILVNVLTTSGALINAYYKFFPRIRIKSP